ncbi:MAG: hypothetical protein EA392_03210 [Cryomorphaceae bacterium]|nr:MAG: hypothetical protein EA392_03210 [Cryomorphaceae bacterium]
MPRCAFAILVCFLLVAEGSIAQSQREMHADSLARMAIALMEEGEPVRAIELLEDAKKLFNKWLYDYEIGLAYYIMEDYARAEKILKKVQRRDGSDPLQYKMLGNTYSLMGNRDKARKTYHKGLKKFPNAGSLYLELGVVEKLDANFEQALYYWEQGIAADPLHASNYYWAAKFFDGTQERIWALLYGEIFLNLEFNTPRVNEISALLFEVYNDVHENKGDTAQTLHLTQKGFTINVSLEDLKNLKKSSAEEMAKLFRLPFEGVVSLSMAIGSIHYNDDGSIDLEGIHQLRTAFIEHWMLGEDNKQETYPFVLFPFHARMMEQGLFQYYNYFLFRAGDPEAFEAFKNDNEAGFFRFFEWYNQNHLPFGENIHSRLLMF